jgi:hypothetical protein
MQGAADTAVRLAFSPICPLGTPFHLCESLCIRGYIFSDLGIE